MAADRRGRVALLALFALASFAAAFLSFSVQPLLAKWLLPALGGSPATWASCLVFFQSMLVLGYLLAELGAAGRGRFAYLGLAVLAIASALLQLPLTAASEGVTGDSLERAPALPVLWLLGARVGLPFLLLASVAPLVQRWAAELAGSGAHRLYAGSNAGSLAALLSYPVLIEPGFPLATQWRLWSCAAAFVVALMAVLAIAQRVPVNPTLPVDHGPLGAGRRLRWVIYAAVPCALLLATTTYLTTDIAAVPLLWVVPLSLYLLTFVAAFGGAGPRTERAALTVFLLASAGIGWNAFDQGIAPFWRQVTVSLAALTSASLLCHIELVRVRPPAVQLTAYYVWIAIGGALGSISVALLAPWLLSDYYELELAVLATYACLLARTRRLPTAPPELQRVRLRRPLERSIVWVGLGLCAPVLLYSLWLRAYGSGGSFQVIERRRSYLGALRVTQLSVGRVLTHGRIQHGMQLNDPALRRLPTMYYGEGTALARVFEQHRAGAPRRIGVIGLGAGTIAAHGKTGDRITFYELDAQVIDVAQTQFSFLRDSPARIDLRLGDGRLSLARDSPQGFDILVLDAFASDSVPVHLLTAEAFRLYLQHLAPDGVLLANVANRHLAVDRVVRGAARAYGLACAIVETPADPDRFVSKVRWAVISRQGEQISRLVEGMELVRDPFPGVMWTDDRASLWSVLR